MSYFSTALQRAIEQARFNQSDLARASGMSKSSISRLVTGEPNELSDPNFVALLGAFGPSAQADLIAARCLDTKEAPRAAGLPGAALVAIHVERPSGKPASPSENLLPQVQLPDETERVFAWLRSQCPLNPELEKHLVGYARLLGMRG